MALITFLVGGVLGLGVALIAGILFDFSLLACIAIYLVIGTLLPLVLIGLGYRRATRKKAERAAAHNIGARASDAREM